MNESHDRSSGPVAPASSADVLSDVLGAIKLTGSMLFQVEARTPWVTWAPRSEAFRYAVLPGSQHLISYHVVTRGGCWAGLRGESPERFEAGEALVVPQGDAYFLANPPDAEQTYGTSEALEFFRRMSAGELPTVVSAGGEGERTQFICGFLGCRLRPFNPVLAALPRMLHLRASPEPTAHRMRHLIAFALDVMRAPSSGGRDVLMRLAELMFVEVVRGHLETMVESQTGWLAGLKNPTVARALALLHSEPARDWTLDALADQIGASRSVLAERFTQYVGLPPMQYLTQWRMHLASQLLVDSRRTKMVAVAAAVGYKSEAAFSRAFKRSVGVTATEWRQGAI